MEEGREFMNLVSVVCKMEVEMINRFSKRLRMTRGLDSLWRGRDLSIDAKVGIPEGIAKTIVLIDSER